MNTKRTIYRPIGRSYKKSKYHYQVFIYMNAQAGAFLYIYSSPLKIYSYKFVYHKLARIPPPTLKRGGG